MGKASPGTGGETSRKILIVDDHPMMRKGLAALIAVEPSLAVCGEATNCQAALAAIRKSQPAILDAAKPRFTCTSNNEMAAGVMPCMRAAWPTVSGLC